MLDQVQFQAIVAKANLAPSVHNTQPARWHLERDGSILIAANLSRHLSIGDPQYRDMGVSCGAATEGTVLALAEYGILTTHIEDLWEFNDITTLPGHRLAARLTLRADGQAMELGKHVADRFTWRSYFRPVSHNKSQEVLTWAANSPDVCLAHSQSDIGFLADLADEAAMLFLRDKAFRTELLAWMRLSPKHANYQLDGMNLEAVQMGRLEGIGARMVLGTRLFDALDKVGLAKQVSGEASKTRSSSAVMMFHRPRGESALETGRAFYRIWLEVTRLGFSAWPMAALADNPVSAQLCQHRFELPEDRRLINVLRLGELESGCAMRARLVTQTLLV